MTNTKKHRYHGRYCVQYVMPVDNPVNNVSKHLGKEAITFLVPINHPFAHNLGYQELLAAAELSGLLTPSPELNKKSREFREDPNKLVKQAAV